MNEQPLYSGFHQPDGMTGWECDAHCPCGRSFPLREDGYSTCDCGWVYHLTYDNRRERFIVAQLRARRIAYKMELPIIEIA